jgi:phosphoribosylaminoimidazolecarboxamide formyltransferase / IMP cyclohydrolase
MTEDKKLRRINRALISVSDKAGLIELVQALKLLGVEIISTGGTAKALREARIPVRDVSEITGFPEMMDGRIKTLHPRVHGGLLALRNHPDHVSAMEEHGIEPIDLVVVNLYPFAQTIAKEGVTSAEAIEQIDIGGPAMIRSAAKNHNDVTVLVAPEQYETLIAELNENGGSTSFALRQSLAAAAFAHTAEYDTRVANYFADVTSGLTEWTVLESTVLQETRSLELQKITDLRYGENPHQQASLCKLNDASVSEGTLAAATLLSGKEMSFNNYVDAEAAWQLVCDFDSMACAIIKHTNPAGVG